MEKDVGPDEPADAAAAFEALRREVALLNVAVAGLAAERKPAPDYSETLGEIAKGVSVVVGRLGKMMTSPALLTSPTDFSRQITGADDEARRQDRATLQQALAGIREATQNLEGWIDRARVASTQNWRLVQVGAAGILVGALLGALLPEAINQAAPQAEVRPEGIIDSRAASGQVTQRAFSSLTWGTTRPTNGTGSGAQEKRHPIMLLKIMGY